MQYNGFYHLYPNLSYYFTKDIAFDILWLFKYVYSPQIIHNSHSVQSPSYNSIYLNKGYDKTAVSIEKKTLFQEKAFMGSLLFARKYEVRPSYIDTTRGATGEVDRERSAEWLRQH